MRRQKDDNRIVIRSLAMVFQVGLNMLVPIGMMTALGVWLDGRFGTSYITIALFVVGAVAGAQNVYRMVRGIFRDEEQDEGRDGSGEENGSVEKD